jgi:hypothetical protein
MFIPGAYGRLLCAAKSLPLSSVRVFRIPSGIGLKARTSGPVQSCRCLVRHYFSWEQFCFPVNKGGCIGLFTGAFYGVPLPITRAALPFNDFRAFINGNTVGYPAPAVFYPLPLPQFRLSLPEMLFQRRVLCRLPVSIGVDSRYRSLFSPCPGYSTSSRPATWSADGSCLNNLIISRVSAEPPSLGLGLFSMRLCTLAFWASFPVYTPPELFRSNSR